MSENKGVPQYRCQRCGEVAMNMDHALVDYNVIDVIAQNPLAIAVSDMRLRLPHGCEDGGTGVAIFIGLLPEALVAKLKAHQEAQRQAAEEQANKDKSKASSLN